MSRGSPAQSSPAPSALSVATLIERLHRRREAHGETCVPVGSLSQREAQPLNTTEVFVTSVTHDSRRVEPGSLYVALAGRVTHGARFIDSALERGAVAIALPLDTPHELWSPLATETLDAPPLIWLAPERARYEMAWIAAWVYRSEPLLPESSAMPDQEHPSRLELVGLTGTNGKTTASTLLADILTEVEGDVGLIGTIETRGGAQQPRAAQMTTMESPDLHAHYRALIDAGVKRCVMEVSSIGIEEERVSASRYSRAAFLNLSPDHLDYHGDMERYARAKLRLFDELLTSNALAVICVDGDDLSNRVAAEAISLTQASGGAVWRVEGHTAASGDSPDRSADVYWRTLTFTMSGIEGTLMTPRGLIEICSPLIGRFNASNIAVAAALAASLDVPNDLISRALRTSAIRGRMELVSLNTHDQGTLSPTVRVDYAHSPDALARAIKALREHQRDDISSPARAWALFGCGGGRDSQKRPLMGSAAALADGVALTSDNPRDEDPSSIADEALAGALEAGLSMTSRPEVGGVYVELDRGVAIHHLIRAADPRDHILIAGKGHEPYQELSGGERVPFSDQEHARCALEARAWLETHENALSVDELSLSTAALCHDAGGVLKIGAHQTLSGPAIDTRKIIQSDTGPAFFCLRGARDGHDFIDVALSAGASAIVVKRGFEVGAQLREQLTRRGAALIEVTAPQDALARWSTGHRRRVFSGVMVGLTGSNGKTSTKDLIASALSEIGPTLATGGNFNNHLGVPLTLLRLRSSHAFAVIEMGMNAPDEIRQLTRWAQPDLGVITTIASAHLEKLGSIEAVARAKGEIISELRGPVLIPQSVSRHLRAVAAQEAAQSGEVYVLPMSQREAQRVDQGHALLEHERSVWPPLNIDDAQMSLEGGVAQLSLSQVDETGQESTLECELRIQLRGRHQLENARIAFAAAIAAVEISRGSGVLKLDQSRPLDLVQVQTLLDGLAKCPPAPLRGEVSTYPRRSVSPAGSSLGGLNEDEPAEGVLWLDCYNANPQSVLASLRTFLDCGLRGALILGSIGELGAASAELHERLGQSIAHILRDTQSEGEMSVFTVGEDARHLARGLIESGGAHLGHVEPSDLSALVDRISHLNPPAIFVKGSRSVRLERVATLLETPLTETRSHSQT